MVLSLNDAKLSALEGLGFAEGTLNDRELAWLVASGASPGSTISDGYLSVLTGLGYPLGSLDDRLYSYLKARGFTGNYNDSLYQWWQAGGGWA